MYTLRLVSSLVTCSGPHNLFFAGERPTRIVEVSDKRFVIAGAIYQAISGNIQEGAAAVGADLILIDGLMHYLDGVSRRSSAASLASRFYPGPSAAAVHDSARRTRMSGLDLKIRAGGSVNVGWRIHVPAAELEGRVIERLPAFLKSDAQVFHELRGFTFGTPAARLAARQKA